MRLVESKKLENIYYLHDDNKKLNIKCNMCGKIETMEYFRSFPQVTHITCKYCGFQIMTTTDNIKTFGQLHCSRCFKTTHCRNKNAFCLCACGSTKFYLLKETERKLFGDYL